MRRYLGIFVILLIISCEDNGDSEKNCNLYEERGSLVSSKRTFQYSKESIASLAKSFYGIDETSLNIENAIDVYSVVYKSIGPDDKPVELSGAIYVPVLDDGKAMPTLSIGHYTNTEQYSVPSVSPTTGPQGILGSMQGYFSIYADGYGFGVSDAQPSFVNKKVSAETRIDLLKASKEFACENDIELNDQLFTTGYSAGGYNTMAFHQYIEEKYPEFTITANAPLAGPYSTMNMGRTIFEKGIYHQPYYLGFALWGYINGTGDSDALNRWVNEPYREPILTMYDGSKGATQINNALNDTISVLLKRSFLDGFLGDGEQTFKQYLKDQSFIYDGWTPKAPIHFMHGKDDTTVFHYLMEEAATVLKSNGATQIQTTSYDGNHNGAASACMIESLNWFNTFKQ